ncbi:hypothetical protein OMO38_05210 [Chryseobacterium sp. 09-1422]|uniref:Uncharacterized protein n=1 Tax=Chryseobacterium kimseyorum TaxID=2984028 RepID=A0ABT3HVV7_9FLAO|nr:hypothetical protein [Chryseobacterium kimseyorum]MCW3167921.1 hypothetical protein [Chryseobacterium kimseyorum]
MEKELNSGKEVVKNFISQMDDIPNVDKKTAEVISSLHEQNKLTEKNLQNALDNLLLEELKKTQSENE